MNGIAANNAVLAAVDDLGRTLPAFEEVGYLRKEKYVGMFYFLTLGSGHYKFYHEGLNGPINVTEILEKYPEAHLPALREFREAENPLSLTEL